MPPTIFGDFTLVSRYLENRDFWGPEKGLFGPFWPKNREYLEAGEELGKTTYTSIFPVLLRFFYVADHF